MEKYINAYRLKTRLVQEVITINPNWEDIAQAWREGYNLALMRVVDRLEEMPAADVVEMTIENAIEYLRSIGWMQEHDRQMMEMGKEERHGRWEQDYQDKWRCSVCKVGNNYAYAFDAETKDYTILQDKYCPNCGAKMDEVTE